LDHQNNYVERLNVNDKAAKSFNILAISLNILHIYFGPNTIIFRSVSIAIFRYFSKTVLSVNIHEILHISTRVSLTETDWHHCTHK